MNVFFEGSMTFLFVAMLVCMALLVCVGVSLALSMVLLARLEKNIYNDDVANEYARCESFQLFHWVYSGVSLLLSAFAAVALYMSLRDNEDSFVMILFLLCVSVLVIVLVTNNAHGVVNYWRWEIKPLKKKLGSGARSDYARKTGSIPIIPDK